ncbi:MAG: DUF305 domain-containing protein [Nocardioides sp.]
MTRAVAGVIGTAALAAALAACGDENHSDHQTGAKASDDTRTAVSGAKFNGADVTFATDMIPHHAQAIELVTLTDGREVSPPLAELANDVRDAQAPEVETMSDWLIDWGEEVPETSMDHENAGHDMDDMDMPGMLDTAEMTAIENASGAEFEKLWLVAMKKHHEGAIEMAEAEQADGVNPDAVALAESIETGQRAEIERIDELLAGS